MGGGDGTMMESKKKVEENEKGDKKNRVLEWGSNPVGSDCASGGIPTSYCTNHWAAAIITNCILTSKNKVRQDKR